MRDNEPQEEDTTPAINVPQHGTSKPFLTGCSHKKVPIGLELHQVEPPPLLTPEQFDIDKKNLLAAFRLTRRHAVFQASQVDQAALTAYLKFTDDYFDERDPQSFGPGQPSRDRMHSQALGLLHDTGYNFTKARFFIIFPYYLHYNRYRSNSQITISDDEMEKKVREHLQSLKNCKSKDMQRWASQLESLVETKVNITKVQQLVEQGRQNKFEVPEAVREQMERAVKLGKDLKKTLSGKVSLEKLLQRRESIIEQKILTNQIISFEETVSRCQDWIVKANQFQNEYFEQADEETRLRELKKLPNKIQYRQLNLLVQEYSNLPVLHSSFEQNTKRIHDWTNQLLDKLPQFIKTARTRTNPQTKMSYSNILQLLQDVRRHPVWHPDFESFDRQIHQCLELVERVSMCLEDGKYEKNIKNMMSFVKLTSDLPIQTNITVRLESYMEYSNIIQKIRKDIVQPQKLEQTQQLIAQAFKKGFNSPELVDLQSKLEAYRGWFQSAQMIKEAEIEISLVDLIKNQQKILNNMIDEEVFRNQFAMAQKQLNFELSMVQEYSKRLTTIMEQKRQTARLLSATDPDLDQLVKHLLTCIRQAISYPQLQVLIRKVRGFLSILCKMRQLMDLYQFRRGGPPNFFLTKDQYDQLSPLLTTKKQLKEMQKFQAENILNEATNNPFPRNLNEFQCFQQFLNLSRNWQERSSNFILNYEMTSHLDSSQLDSLIGEAEDTLHDQQMLRKLQDINNISRWKHVIESRLDFSILTGVFDEEQKVIMRRMAMDITNFQQRSDAQGIKTTAMEYLKNNRQPLQRLMEKVINIKIERTHKLPELSKLMKQLDRQDIRDPRLAELKRSFANNISNCQQWKERCVVIRKADWRKAFKNEKTNEQSMEPEDIYIGQPPKKNEPSDGLNITSLKSNQICYYFKLPLLIIELSRASQLHIALDELSKIKLLVSESYSLMQRIQEMFNKEKPTYQELITLEQEGSKLNIFSVEYELIKRRSDYVMAWRSMANSVIDSMLILRLEQLKLKPAPEIVMPAPNLDSEPKRKSELVDPSMEQQQIYIPEAEPVREQATQTEQTQNNGKRKRRQNPLYNNDSIALLTEDLYTPKPKKRRRQTAPIQSPRRYRNEHRKQNRNEQMQREVEDYYEHPVSYCICRLGLMNETSVMLECQQCLEWFHTQCIGIRKSYVKNVDKYICLACCRFLKKKPDYQSSFFWETHLKLSEPMFQELVKQGQELGIQIDELSRLEQVQMRIQNWKNEVSRVVDSIWPAEIESTDDEADKAHGKQLFGLYLQSFWLPTLHLQTDILYGLLLRHKL